MRFDDKLATITLNKHLKYVQENVFLGKPISAHFMMHDKVKFNGGMMLIQPIVSADNSTVKNFRGDDTFGDPGEVLDNAFYDWHSFGGQIKYNQDVLDRNAGQFAMANYVTEHTKVLKMTLQEKLEKLILGAKGGSGAASYTWHGLKDIVGTRDNTVGGIPTNSSNNNWWEPRHKVSGSTTFDVGDVDEMILELSRGGTDKPTLIYSKIALWRQMHNTIFKQERFGDEMYAKAGFTNISIQDVPWVYLDSGIASDTNVGIADTDIYFLNEDYLTFWCHSNHWMRNSGFLRSQNSLVQKAIISCKGTLSCSRRSSQGYLKVANS